MKTFLLATVAGLGLSTASHAAIIEYGFTSAQMTSVHPDPTVPKYYHFTAAIRIDTDAMESKSHDFWHISGDPLPSGFLNVTEDVQQGFKLTFDNDWNIIDYFMTFDSDGSDRGADNGGATNSQYYYELTHQTSVAGTWVKTILADASAPFDNRYIQVYGDEPTLPVEAPAPVPLPAAGFLLMGALGGLGLMKRRNKAAA